MHILLVGGAVRNLLLGRPTPDKDFVVVDADESDFLDRFPEARKVGGHFPVFLMNGCQYALLRAGDLEGDLRARDLTINAMALDEDGCLYCHPQALEDMGNRVLRPCGPESLTDDPLRVFRSARFAAQFPGFTAHDDLVRAMRDVAEAGLLEAIAPERVGHELLLALEAPAPSRFLLLLAKASCLSPWFRELVRADRVPAGPATHHALSVLGHTCQVMDRLAGRPLAVWMGLAHDLGKTATDQEHWPAHHGHEEAGEPLARDLALRLRLPGRHVAAGEAAARLHMKALRYPELRPGTKVDLLMALHTKGLLRETFALAAADHGRDHLGQALADLRLILGVRLRPDDRDLGEASGKLLRQLRAQVLAQHMGMEKNNEL